MHMLRKLLLIAGIVVAAAHAGTAVAQTQFDIDGEIDPGTCQWVVGDDDRTIVFDPIDASVLNAKGSGGFKQFNLSVQNCAPGLSTVIFGFSGLTDTTDPLRNLNRGTAQGVAVELEWASDGTTIGANSTNNIHSVPIVGNGATIGLQAGYWRVGSITPGTVEAIVTVVAQYL